MSDLLTLAYQASNASPAAGAAANGSLSGHFTGLDWTVLIGYLALVSFLGVWLAGKQKDMQDFFRGGDKLPWYAVSASLIATTISAVTFVGVPAVAFAGNMTYLQLGVISGLISRAFVAFILVPAYYKKRIYSPYDYMGNQLGGGAKGVTTGLFTLGGLMAQSARVYLTALVLTLVMSDELGWLQSVTAIPSLDFAGLSPLASAIIIIGIIAVLWTMAGGIATVVWTDALLFLVFVSGGIAALWVIITQLPEGWTTFIDVGNANEKFTVFNIDKAFDVTENYTIAAAGFAVAIGNIGAYGTDQLLAQRIFCCKSKRDAQWAMLSSYAAEAVTLLMLLVGVGLFVFYTTYPEKLSGEAAHVVAHENDKIFPAFILQQMPAGVTGLVIAGIFAAAISSLTSILAALAQTTVSAVYLPMRARQLKLDQASEESLAEHDQSEGRRIVTVSRWLIVFWGIALCLAAFVVDAFKDATGVPILDLALGLASYIVGGLFAAFMLAWLPLKVNGRGLVWAAPLGVISVFAVRFHEQWSLIVVAVLCAVLFVTWLVFGLRTADSALRGKRLVKTIWLVAGCAVVLAIAQSGYFHKYQMLAVDDEGNVLKGTAAVFAEDGTAVDENGDPLKVIREVVREDAVALDDAGQELADPQPVTEAYRHPITEEPLVDAAGKPVVDVPNREGQFRYQKRTTDGEVLMDGPDNPQAQTTAEPKLYAKAARLKKVTIAWPWYAVIGGAMAFIFGYLLADRKA